jgi:hypothetical protein
MVCATQRGFYGPESKKNVDRPKTFRSSFVRRCTEWVEGEKLRRHRVEEFLTSKKKRSKSSET